MIDLIKYKLLKSFRHLLFSTKNIEAALDSGQSTRLQCGDAKIPGQEDLSRFKQWVYSWGLDTTRLTPHPALDPQEILKKKERHQPW